MNTIGELDASIRAEVVRRIEGGAKATTQMLQTLSFPDEAILTVEKIRVALVEAAKTVKMIMVEDLKGEDGDSINGHWDFDTKTLELSSVQDGNDLRSTAFHELVHAAGGNELDAQVLAFMFGKAYSDVTAKGSAKENACRFAEDGGTWFGWDSCKKRATLHGVVLAWPEW